jgi:hypothetical protein
MMLVFVVGLFAGAGTVAWAQAQRVSALPSPGQRFTITTDSAGHVLSTTTKEPFTLTNEAVGLRVSGTREGRVVGTLVAKIDGKWVEVQLAPQDFLVGR